METRSIWAGRGLSVKAFASNFKALSSECTEGITHL